MIEWCWLTGHMWEIINIWNYWDTSFNARIACHNITLQCKKCGKIKTESKYAKGFLYLNVTDNKDIDD